MKATLERRVASSTLNVRSLDSGLIRVEGYASTFSNPYDMGWYTEVVDPGAFSRTLGRNPDVRFLIEHDGLPLARTTSGTLILSQDEIGLHVRADLDATDPDVARIVPKMERGDLTQMSFGFRIDAQGQSWNQDYTERHLTGLDLNDGDVSIVTYPANPNTTIGLRSDAKTRESVMSVLRELELRDASNETTVSVLTRILGYLSAVDAIVDNAQEEVAEALGIPNPDDDVEDIEASEEDLGEVEAARAAAATETRRRIAAMTRR